VVALATRFKWFDRGAEAFARACPDVVRDILPPAIGPVYVCPLCITRSSFRAFRRLAVEQKLLTEEHAPQGSLGGHALVLTCATCNHTAGTRLESHARKAENPAAALLGDLKGSRPVRVKVGDLTINATLRGGLHRGYQLFGLPEHNPPQAHEEFFQELGRIAQQHPEDWAIGLDFYRDRHDPDKAAASWLRAAYLIVFAKFGYRFVLGRAYHAVREKISDPKSGVIQVFKVTDAKRSTESRAFVIVREPGDLRGIAVQMGRHVVFLPGPSDTTFYNRLSETQGHGGVTVNGWGLSWPTEPEHYFDFLESAET